MPHHQEPDDEFAAEQAKRKAFLYKTYLVTLIMLITGQIQVVAAMQIDWLKTFLKEYYYVSLLQFFMSFLAIQLYVFFYHILQQKGTCTRLFWGLWTFESNTISIMKPAKVAPYLCFGISWVLTILVMAIGIIYGNIAVHHKHGLFLTRHNVIRWSERLFVLTSFGIIVCSEMKRIAIEFPTMFVYTMMSNIFVIIFGASIRKPNFYHVHSPSDFILIGQLYYLNFYALYMGYVFTMASGIEFYKSFTA